MLLNSVIIILREVLEAALIISIFLAFSHVLKLSRRWLISACLMGGAGAATYALSINLISEWVDGAGQELTNAILQLSIYVLLLLFNVTVLFQPKEKVPINRTLYLCILASVVLAITREGSEILLFIYGFVYAPNLLPAVLMGSAIGAGIGLSIGIIFYYLLAHCLTSKLLPIGIITIMLVGAGMVSQSIQQLIQADLLPSQRPLWDTSDWMPEDSVAGQLLYALIGYEATPSPLQVMCYLSSIAIMMLLMGLAIFRKSRLN